MPRGALGSLDLASPAPGLAVLQPRRGYRFGVEVYALAHFALLAPARRAIDLGAGSGIIGLLLARAGLEVEAVERDPAWTGLAKLNAKLSRQTVRVHRFTLRPGTAPGLRPADLVVTNPPWFDPAAGPVSPDRRKAVARTMSIGTVADFVDAGLRLAPRVCVVTRVEREPMLSRPGAHVARRAPLGTKLLLAEVRRGEGNCREEVIDLDAAYRRFSRERVA